MDEVRDFAKMVVERGVFIRSRYLLAGPMVDDLVTVFRALRRDFEDREEAQTYFMGEPLYIILNLLTGGVTHTRVRPLLERPDVRELSQTLLAFYLDKIVHHLE